MFRVLKLNPRNICQSHTEETEKKKQIKTGLGEILVGNHLFDKVWSLN